MRKNKKFNLTKKIHEINSLDSKSFDKCIAFTEFLPKKCESKFPYLPKCAAVLECIDNYEKKAFSKIISCLFTNV